MSRLARGSVELIRRYRIWVLEDGPKVAVQRVAGGLAAVGFVGGICLAAPAVLWPIAVVWCIGAWRAAGPAPAAASATSPPRQLMTPSQARTFLANRITILLGDRRGVHLDMLLMTLQGDGVLPASVTVADLRRDLTVRGIPTRDSVKVAGLNRVGIHRDDLPALSQPLPDTALAEAG